MKISEIEEFCQKTISPFLKYKQGGAAQKIWKESVEENRIGFPVDKEVTQNGTTWKENSILRRTSIAQNRGSDYHRDQGKETKIS